MFVSDIIGVEVTLDQAGTTKTVTLPTTGVSPGDMMCVAIGFSIDGGDATDEMATPTDWTKESDLNVALPETGGTTPRMYFYWREVPTGGLGSSVDFTVTTSNSACCAVAFAVTNVITSALGVIATDTGDSTTIGFPVATSSNTGGLTIRLGVSDDDDQSAQPAVTGHTPLGWIKSGQTNGNTCYVWAQAQEGASISAASATIVSEEWAAATCVVIEKLPEPKPLGPAVIRKPWTRQPPPGTPLDRDHPWFKDLVMLVPFNEPGVAATDLVTGARGTIASTGTSTMVKSVNQYGLHIDMEYGVSTDQNGFTFEPNEKWQLDGKAWTALCHVNRENEVHSGGSRVISSNSGSTGFELVYRGAEVRAVVDNVHAVLGVASSTGDSFMAGTYDGANIRAYYRDSPEGDVTTTNVAYTAAMSPSTVMNIGQEVTERHFDGRIYWVAVFKQTFSEDEILKFWDNPWQIFKPPTIYIPEPDVRQLVVF